MQFVYDIQRQTYHFLTAQIQVPVQCTLPLLPLPLAPFVNPLPLATLACTALPVPVPVQVAPHRFN